MTAPLEFLPARRLPLLYLGAAHLSLLVACFVVAADPRGVIGFYYGPRIVAVVHLVTLGWITGSILGSLYLVCPLAFRTPLPAGRGDAIAFASYAIGVSGVASHFGIDRLSGMVWSATMVLGALVFVGFRVVRGLVRSPVRGAGRSMIVLAFANVFGAVLLGILLGLNKNDPFLPAGHFRIVLGHAHLAVLGWPILMVMGAGSRLLPMILPAGMPAGPWPYVGAGLTTAGAWGLFVTLAGASPWLPLAAATAAAGIAVFLGQVVWMVRHPRPAPTARPRPEWSLAHVAQALGYLFAGTVLGLVLAVLPASEASLRWAWVYGVFVLLGFLGHLIVGVAGRLIPLYAWLWGFADRGHRESPPSLHGALSRGLQAAVLFLWTLGVPLLAAGLYAESAWAVTAAASSLGLATVGGAANLTVALARLWRPVRSADPPRS